MAEAIATVWQLSDELKAALGKLSQAQARAIIRIVEAEVTGQTVEALFSGKNKICNRATYYRPRGWSHKPVFVLALELARREVRAQRMSSIVNEALDELKAATPLAALDLRRQIVGDEAAIDMLAAIARDPKRKADERLMAVTSLGVIGTQRATEALLAVANDSHAGIRLRVIEVMGISAAGISPQRRRAAVDVLDRADELTADKGGQTNDELDAEIERRLALLAQGGQAQAAGTAGAPAAKSIEGQDPGSPSGSGHSGARPARAEADA